MPNAIEEDVVEDVHMMALCYILLAVSLIQELQWLRQMMGVLLHSESLPTLRRASDKDLIENIRAHPVANLLLLNPSSGLLYRGAAVAETEDGSTFAF